MRRRSTTTAICNRAIPEFIRVGKARWIPGEDETDKITVADSYEIKRDSPRNTGTHFVLGFRLITRDPGVYGVNLYFLTSEAEGRSTSSRLRVEEKPKTLMRCRADGHWGCFVRPNIVLTPNKPPPKTQARQQHRSSPKPLRHASGHRGGSPKRLMGPDKIVVQVELAGAPRHPDTASPRKWRRRRRAPLKPIASFTSNGSSILSMP